MADPQDPIPSSNLSSKPKIEPPISSGTGTRGANFSGKHNHHSINPPESSLPDAATLRDQWRYAVRLYSKWYSHAWGTAILAGVSFFALGWVIKGENPIESWRRQSTDDDGGQSSSTHKSATSESTT